MFDRFLNDFYKRLLVVILLPNILVLEFWANDMNNNHNYLWYNLIGPYWHLEEYIVVATVLTAAAILAWMGLQYVPKFIDAYFEFKGDWHRTQEKYRFQQEQDRQRVELKAEEKAAEKTFLALPLEERKRIETARLDRTEAERQRWVKAKQELDLRQKAEAEGLQREKDQDLERKRVQENSPEYQREKALRDFTGGGGR